MPTEKQKIITQADLGDLHPKEIELIWIIRNYWRYGELLIKTHDGIPTDIEQTIKRHRLGNGVIGLSTGMTLDNEYKGG